MASYNYAVYKFGNKRLAIQLPKGKTIEDVEILEDGIDLLDRLINEYEEELGIFHIKEPLSKLSLNDLYLIRNAIMVIHELSWDISVYKIAFFHFMYKEHFEKVINEADENFSFGKADVWIE